MSLDKTKDEYYATRQDRLNTIVGDIGPLWSKIFLCQSDYKHEHGHNEGFFDYLQDTYGIKTRYVNQELDLKVDIVNEKLYTIFLLKYS